MEATEDYKYWLERHIGWFIVVGVTAIPVAGWLLNAHPVWSTANWLLAFSNLGKIFGIIGFMFFALNLVFSLRKRWLERLFGGLNRVYIAHHLTGGIALILLCFHPLL